MTWWKRSLYDTCSLITLDKLLLDRVAMAKHFPKSILALQKSFSADQLRQPTAKRMRPRVTIRELPSSAELAIVFSSTTLSPALAEVDKLVFATAAHFRLSVVTSDRQLGRAVKEVGLQVMDFASILRELVHADKITADRCEELLENLARRNDLLLGSPKPTWADLEAHSFPDRKPRTRKK